MDKLREADTVVSCLGQAMLDGESGLKNVPGLLLRVINEDLWQERVIAQTGERATFRRFVDFVATKPLEGLGADLPTLKRLCADNPAALDALDRVTVQSPGRPKTENRNNVTNYEEPDRGNRADYALRKLRADAPDMHARVLAGELSPHAAMVEAGYRKKNYQIPAEPEAAARALLRKFTADELQQIVEIIADHIAVDA